LLSKKNVLPIFFEKHKVVFNQHKTNNFNLNYKMFQSHFGEIAALLTAVFWTTTALAFEAASKKAGSLVVNLLRLFTALILLSVYCWVTRGVPFPTDASAEAWIWLSISGFIGFVFGDYCLLKAYTIIGSRISMLIMALVPLMTALFGWFTLGETMTAMQSLGMFLTLSGIAIVVLKRKTTEDEEGEKTTRLKISYPLSGLLFAVGGALGQAIGLVMSKKGMGEYNAFAASQIRVFAGLIGFAVLFLVLNRWRTIGTALRHRSVLVGLGIGSVFGPFLGVSFSLLAVQYTTTGIASTIMAIVPVLIIAPAVLIFKEKLFFKEVIGAIISVAGVICFFV